MKFIAPMLASALPDGDRIELYTHDKFVMERKYDGHRRIIHVADGGMATAWSREGNAVSIPVQIAMQLALLASGVYDGEFYIPGQPCTAVVDSDKQHLVRCVLFDMLAVDGHSAQAKPFRERRALLEVAVMHVDPAAEFLTITEQFAPSADLLQAWYNSGHEGAIVKRLSAIYQSRMRSRDWVKFKKLYSAHTTITGFVAAKLGKYAKIAAVDARGVVVTVKTLNAAWRRKFEADPQAWIGRTLVIAYPSMTEDGKYFHARADHIL